MCHENSQEPVQDGQGQEGANTSADAAEAPESDYVSGSVRYAATFMLLGAYTLTEAAQYLLDMHPQEFLTLDAAAARLGRQFPPE